ncbi:MAG: ABC transporter permease [Planctomycetota bacterium]
MSVLFDTFGAAVRIATPLVLAATGETIAERGGVLNVGIEGIMLAAACAAFLATLATGSALAGVLLALLVGLLLALLLAGLVLGLGVDQVVCGLGINLLALGGAGTAYRLVVGPTGSDARLGELPHFLGHEPFAWVALGLVLLVWWLVSRSTWGVALRATGDAPLAAEAAGIGVRRTRLLALLAGGAFAALAGADLELAHARTFAEDLTGGRGFMALALVLFGRWSPLKVALAALFFGAAEAAEAAIQARGAQWLTPYKELVLALPYLLTLAVLALPRRPSTDETPGALGRPLDPT